MGGSFLLRQFLGCTVLEVEEPPQNKKVRGLKLLFIGYSQNHGPLLAIDYMTPSNI